MRLLLLPITTRRALIYCEPRSQAVPKEQQSYLDRAVNKAADTWASFEKSDTTWKLKLTQYGNKMLRRIPYEEWGLKSIPPQGKDPGTSPGMVKRQQKVVVQFPALFQGLQNQSVIQVIGGLATGRQDLHKKRLTWSIVAMPLTVPFGLIPILPNIPFFYLGFRAYSHWRALSGSRHLDHLVKSGLLSPSPSPTLDILYTSGLLHSTRQESRDAAEPTQAQSQKIVQLIRQQSKSSVDDQSPGQGSAERKHSGESPGLQDESTADQDGEEIMLLQVWNAKLIAERLKLPELEVEIERAVEQVESSLRKAREARAEGDTVEQPENSGSAPK